MTGINRRQFSLLLAGALVSPALLAKTGTTKPLFASAATDDQGKHHLLLISEQGDVILDQPLPTRAHHVEWHPHKPWLAAVARRPGTYIEVMDYQTGQRVHRVNAPQGRHFYGHAIFSRDGRYLIACENRVSDGTGRITLRDSQQGFKQVADFPSYGIGPHELAQMPDGDTLVVANGGILTHPDQGREKLNLDTMRPSLAYIDLHTGELLEQVEPAAELHQLSIRHLDVNSAGTVAIALQYQGPRHHDMPLVAVHRRGNALKLLRAPEPINQAMKLYCGSARFDRSGRYFAISSPRGDLVTFWDSQVDRFVSHAKTRDGCGLAATPNAGEFLISSGLGRLYRYEIGTQTKKRIALHLSQPVAWDNHMSTL